MILLGMATQCRAAVRRTVDVLVGRNYNLGWKTTTEVGIVSTDQTFDEVMRVPSRRERKAKEQAQRECKHEWEWHATGAGMGHYCAKCDEHKPYTPNTESEDSE